MQRTATLAISEACERNKGPILEILRVAFAGASAVLEVGSGTGQHAVWFARHLPHLVWQPTEIAPAMPGLCARLDAEAPANVRAPVALDVSADPWPVDVHDAVFSANTLHIISWQQVCDFFRGSSAVLTPGGTLCVYGPLRYGGRFTTASNAAFDAWLKTRDPRSGVRDFEAVNALALEHGLELVADHPMPAHNQALVWRKAAPRNGAGVP